jgi:nucleoside-diphosphate-sugar epimerase
VYVNDICNVISYLIKHLDRPPPHHTYNLGGPRRMSRADMARAVAGHMGYPDKAIEAIRSAQMDDRWGALGGKACVCGGGGRRARWRATWGTPTRR